jgi:hypothetical protein
MPASGRIAARFDAGSAPPVSGFSTLKIPYPGSLASFKQPLRKGIKRPQTEPLPRSLLLPQLCFSFPDKASF